MEMPARFHPPRCSRRELLLRFAPAASALLSPASLLGARSAPPSSTSAFRSLKNWAHSQRLKVAYQPSTGVMTLSSRQIRLEFKSDSKRSVLNDVVVWLCRNPIAQNDDLLIAQQDIDKVLDPLWTPTRLPRGKRIRVLAFGAGHGGKDPGKQVGARKEKDFTLRLASELETLARKQGFGVIQVRDKDEFIDLLDRPAIARKRGADLYVSLHFNSFTGPGSETAKGLEVYCMTPAGASSTNDSGGTPMPGMTSNKYDHENILLAYQLQRAILNKSNLDDRGVKRARFLELTQMSMPAALVEGGFMTHPGDARLIFDPKERKRLADGILDGIHAYKGLVERS